MRDALLWPFIAPLRNGVIFDSREYVHEPALFARLVAANIGLYGVWLLLAWFESPSQLWPSVFIFLGLGWLTLLISACAAWQIKVVRALAELLPMKIFAGAVIAGSLTWCASSVRDKASSIFPISPYELTNAIVLSTAMEAAFTIAVILSSVMFVVAGYVTVHNFVSLLRGLIQFARRDSMTVGTVRGLINRRAFLFQLFFAFLAGPALGVALGTFAMMKGDKLLIAHLAMEYDFTTVHACAGVSKDERVLLLSMSAQKGIAAKFNPPAKHGIFSKSFDDLAAQPISARMVDCYAPGITWRPYGPPAAAAAQVPKK